MVQIRTFYKYQEPSELDGGVVVKKFCYVMKEGSPQVRRKGHNANVIFQVGEVLNVQEWQ